MDSNAIEISPPPDPLHGWADIPVSELAVRKGGRGQNGGEVVLTERGYQAIEELAGKGVTIKAIATNILRCDRRTWFEILRKDPKARAAWERGNSRTLAVASSTLFRRSQAGDPIASTILLKFAGARDGGSMTSSHDWTDDAQEGRGSAGGVLIVPPRAPMQQFLAECEALRRLIAPAGGQHVPDHPPWVAALAARDAIYAAKEAIAKARAAAKEAGIEYPSHDDGEASGNPAAQPDEGSDHE
jgi:hypothetical protein